MYKFIDCSKIYSNGNKAFLNVNFSLEDQGLILLKGNSGSGKSSLLNCISGLDKFTTGKIFHNDIEMNSLLDLSTFFFQENKLFENMSIFDNLRITCNKCDEDILDIIKMLRIDDHVNELVSNLSGGQRARVGIARALLQDENIIVLDEPFANLDIESIKIICDSLSKFAASRLIIIASHQDLESFLKFNKIVFISDDHAVSIFDKKIDKTNSISTVEHHTYKKLNFKETVKFLKCIIKISKMKTCMTTVFMLFSFWFLAVVFSITSIDLASFAFKTYHDNNVEVVEFRYSDNFQSVSNDLIYKMNPNYVNYDSSAFSLKKDNGDLFYCNNIVVSNIDNLNDDEAILYIPYDEFVIDSFIYINNMKINIIKTEHSNIKKIIVNNNTYDKLKGNLFQNYEIVLKNSNSGVTSCMVYNPYYYNISNLNSNIIVGRLPNNKNEIVIPISLCDYYFKTITYEEILNMEATFLFSKEYDFINDKNIFETKDFIVTGISEQMIYFETNECEEMLNNYGVSNLDRCDKSISFKNYDKTIFKNAYKNNLRPIDEITNKINSTYNILMFVKNILLIICILFIIISFLTILNNVMTSFTKFKKEIAIMLCFKVNKSSIFKIFMAESLLPIVLAFLLSVFLNNLTVLIVNNLFSNYFNLIMLPLIFHPFFLTIVLGIAALTTLIILICLLVKIYKMSRITALKDN